MRSIRILSSAVLWLVAAQVFPRLSVERGCAADALETSLASPRSARAPEGTPPSELYRKPYITRVGRGAAIGGYMDFEFNMLESGATFDQHRFIPFLYSAVTDYLHVSAEIEFEHGGAVAGDAETDGEIAIEYAVTDFSLDEALNARGGVILSPLGRFNLLHDSPLNDLTERPLVDRQIVPTTLSESGLGVFGAFYPNELWTVAYELYAVNGFNQGVIVNPDDPDAIDLRIREGRGSRKQDNNNHRSIVGRLSVSPSLGTDLGVSLHSGAYDDAGDAGLTIIAFDGQVRRGPVEILGELALASADVPRSLQDAAAKATRADGSARTIAESQRGGYAQANVHFAAGAWTKFPESIWTAVVRADYVDYDADLGGDDARAITAGLNFRPVEDAAFKWDVVWRWGRGETVSAWGDSNRKGSFSIATYF